GIRHATVTGVQTCALPIYSDLFNISLYLPLAHGLGAPNQSFIHSYTFPSMSDSPRSLGSRLPPDQARSSLLAWYQAYRPSSSVRSEERRVGQERTAARVRL